MAIDTSKMAILGPGAIGQLIFHQLSQLAQGIALISRPQPKSGTNSESVQLTFMPLAGEIQHSRARLIDPNDRLALEELELIIVCVKAYQVIEAVTPLLAHLKKGCHLLLLHNGLGPHLELTPQLKGQGLSLGTTSQGALKQGRWQIKQTGGGLTQLGHHAGPQMSSPHRQLLLDALPDSQWCSPILPMLWQKLAVNIAINPLTAILDCPNGKLAQPEYRQWILDLLNEVITVAKLDGIALDRSALIERVFSVIDLTANNFSSMHQDIHHGRQTEIHAINGYLCQRAQYHGIVTPKNAEIVKKIIALESKISTN